MQDQKYPQIPPSIRFIGVYTDSSDPGYRYITFEMYSTQEPYPKNSVMSYQNKRLKFRQNEADKSKLEYMIIGSDAPAYGLTQPYYPCLQKSWQFALLTTWEYYCKMGMSYCQKAVFSLTKKDGKLSVEIADTDGGIHPPRAIFKNDKNETVEAFVMPSEQKPELFEIEESVSESRLEM